MRLNCHLVYQRETVSWKYHIKAKNNPEHNATSTSNWICFSSKTSRTKRRLLIRESKRIGCLEPAESPVSAEGNEILLKHIGLGFGLLQICIQLVGFFRVLVSSEWIAEEWKYSLTFHYCCIYCFLKNPQRKRKSEPLSEWLRCFCYCSMQFW